MQSVVSYMADVSLLHDFLKSTFNSFVIAQCGWARYNKIKKKIREYNSKNNQ